MSSSQFRHCPNLPQKNCQMKKVNISVSDVKITSLPFAREVYDKTDGSFQPPNKDQSLVRHQAIIWGKCGHNVNPPAMDQHPASHLQSAKNKVMSHILIIHHSYPTLFPFMSQVVDISWYFWWFNMVYTWFHCLPSHDSITSSWSPAAKWRIQGSAAAQVQGGVADGGVQAQTARGSTWAQPRVALTNPQRRVWG